MSKNWKNGEWDIPLRRSLIGESLREWGDLHDLLQRVQVDGQVEDQVYWALEKSRVYSTKSLYNCLTHGGVNDKINDLIWKSKIPLKVKVFLWQVFHKKLQTALALSRRGWHGNPLCSVCNLVETVDHILFGCVFSRYIWCCIRDAFNL